MMVPPSFLLLDIALAFVAAAVYLYVARVIDARDLEDPVARSANRSFAIFWYSVSAYTLLTGTRTALGVSGILDLDLHATLRMLTVPLLVLMVASLVYYLTVLHTGRRRWLGPIVVWHAMLFVFYTYLVVWMHPTAVTLTEWRVEIESERALEGPLMIIVLVTLLLPTLFAAGAYLSLYFRTDDPHARRRILLVSSAFLLWFGSAFIASTAGIPQRVDWWPIVSRAISLLAAGMVLLAFRPAPRGGTGRGRRTRS